MCTTPCKRASGKRLHSTGSSGSPAQCSVMALTSGMGWGGGCGREIQGGRDICTHVTDSVHCTAETNTMLESNYIPIKNKYTRIIKQLSNSLGAIVGKWLG